MIFYLLTLHFALAFSMNNDSFVIGDGIAYWTANFNEKTNNYEIPYSFTSKFPNRKLTISMIGHVKTAINMIEAETCIRSVL